MSIRQFRPMTAGTRFRSVSGFDEITRGTPEKSLLEPLKKTGGRNNQGHVTMRAHRAAGTSGSTGRSTSSATSSGSRRKVAEIEYDPNRSARIALLVYADGEKRYILHPKGLKQGDTVMSGPGADVRAGQRAAARRRCRWARRCTTSSSRSARAARWRARPAPACQVVAKEGEYVTLRLASTEMRLVHGAAWRRSARWATRSTSCCRSARRARAAGWASRPKVRGVVDEPGRPPAGRRRGQDVGRPSAGVAVGQAGRRQDAQQEEGVARSLIVRGRKRGKATQS